MQGTRDGDVRVRRCAAEALGNLPDERSVGALLELLPRVAAEDRHLRYTVRRSLGNVLRSDAIFAALLARDDLATSDVKALLDVAVAVKSAVSGRFVLRHLDALEGDRDALRAALAHASRQVDVSQIDLLVGKVRRKSAGDLDFEAGLFRSIEQGLTQRGAVTPAVMRDWAGDLSGRLLRSVEASDAWSSRSLDGSISGGAVWDFQERMGAKRRGRSCCYPVFPHGEGLTGKLVSPPFAAPGRLTFQLAGHDRFSGQTGGAPQPCLPDG